MKPRPPYPPGTCVGCGQPAEHMPLCTACRIVWEHDGDCWERTDERSQFVRDLAAAWMRGYNHEWAKLPKRPELEPIQ